LDRKIQSLNNLKTIKIMEQFAVITANPKTGLVFTPNANLGKDGKQYGFIRVESNNVSFGGFGRVSKRSALITFEADAWKSVAHLYPAGAKVQGKVVNTDSLEHKDGYREMQVADRATGELRAVTSGGRQVYRKTEFTEDLSAVDTKLVYDRVVATVAPQVNLVEDQA